MQYRATRFWEEDNSYSSESFGRERCSPGDILLFVASLPLSWPSLSAMTQHPMYTWSRFCFSVAYWLEVVLAAMEIIFSHSSDCTVCRFLVTVITRQFGQHKEVCVCGLTETGVRQGLGIWTTSVIQQDLSHLNRTRWFRYLLQSTNSFTAFLGLFLLKCFWLQSYILIYFHVISIKLYSISFCM